jgi:transposase-like protein
MKCPLCKKKGVDYGDSRYYCHPCKMEFEEDTEGDFSEDPTRRLERQETARQKRQQPRRPQR